ncbi:MAG: glycine cleavage system protein T [Betaproteobacteria bacterium RIFCSPLOWO2_12_FULL_67_28]|nr:MAG: glycine cleavage system protein T [Betaproteobacteria bacterium RIFCSPLOWO2_12_FULL_67_28]
MTDAPLARTPLHALHLELGARLVAFAGYEMPVQYPAGILAEHLHTRSAASLFDVSHMGQARLPMSAAAAVETLVPVDVLGLAPGRQRYAFFTNEAGGILDDLMFSNASDHYFVVVNAARKEHDFALLAKHCSAEVLAGRALLALQGPLAAQVMQRLAPAATQLGFMQTTTVTMNGNACFVSRSGYTGEDGFEISVCAADADRLARLLLAQPGVAAAGLGARDSLRLEAGLCLYGHDMDDATTPVEAGLEWAIQKVRRRGGAREGGFPGASVILEQLERGTARRRVGLVPEGRAPVREGALLQDAAGRAVGRVTSGGFGASANAPLAMGYVDSPLAAPGVQLNAVVRGKLRHCRVSALPFIPHRYHRRKSQ